MARLHCLRPLTGALLGLVLSLFISSGAVADPPAATYSFTILEVPSTTSTFPTSINNSGQVAGYYYDSSGTHGFVYSNDTFTTLDVPVATTGPVGTGTSPSSINASGQVTGYYFDNSGTHGFVYSNGTFTTLDVPGATDTFATSINAGGQVTGNYFDGSNHHGFIATPMATDIPTLSQWALLLGGGLLIGMALLAQVRRTRPLRG